MGYDNNNPKEFNAEDWKCFANSFSKFQNEMNKLFVVGQLKERAEELRYTMIDTGEYEALTNELSSLKEELRMTKAYDRINPRVGTQHDRVIFIGGDVSRTTMLEKVLRETTHEETDYLGVFGADDMISELDKQMKHENRIPFEELTMPHVCNIDIVSTVKEKKQTHKRNYKYHK